MVRPLAKMAQEYLKALPKAYFPPVLSEFRELLLEGLELSYVSLSIYYSDSVSSSLPAYAIQIALSIGRFTQANGMPSTFRKRMRAGVLDSDMRALDIAVAVLLRLGAPMLLAASLFTRFDPTKFSYSLSLMAVGVLHLVSLYLPTTYELMHDPFGHNHSLHSPPEDYPESLLPAGEATAFQAHATPD